MIHEDSAIVIDLDGTLCEKKGKDQEYIEVEPNAEVLKKLREYRELGFYIIIISARNMRTHEGNIGRINAETLKTIHEWLDRHDVPYDEIHIGRPWCGFNGFYVDDKTIRPDEFLNLSPEEIKKLIG